jgi:predicted ATPase/DNA-binding SARP family transcriptional activator
MHPAPEPLSLEVLGEPIVTRGGRPVACGSRKALALFVFLALTGRRQSRASLAALLWGRDPEAGRTSLRTALQRLPAVLAACIDAQRDSIGLRPEVPILVDALRFSALAGDDGLAGLETASQLYRGELMRGFDADAAPEFEDWLLAERTRYRQLAQAVFDRLIGRHREMAFLDAAAATAARARAVAAARRWLEVEPAAEAAHRWLMQLLVESGQPEAARTQYELCRRALAVTFGRAPSSETRALYDSLNPDGTPAPAAAPPVGGLHAAQVPATPFVGRIEDVATLDRLLADPACRLLTLHGMGGSGKTRLAHVVAHQVLPRFAQGVSWIALEAVRGADGAAMAVARSLGIESAAARVGARAAVCAALQRQQRLLVFDNVEHLMAPEAADGIVELVLAILAAAPAVRVLVTSREVFGVAEEWVYEVGGLPLAPSVDGAPGAQGAADLFVQRARQAYLGFSPSAEWPHIENICRLVDGLPLALELAAAWVRTVPCGEIAAHLEREAGLGPDAGGGRPARQRSLDQVVRYSWQLLDDPLRNDLALLSVFVSTFTHESARGVADATLRQVSALIDKSLLQRRPDGRLTMHPVVRAFAAARLRERTDRADEVLHRHATWFLDRLERCRSRLDSPDEISAEDELNAERVEIARAVDHWVERGSREQLDRLAEPWLRLLVGRGAFREADRVAERLLGSELLGTAARAMTLAMRARVQSLLGHLDQARSTFEAAAGLARGHGLADETAYAETYSVAVPYEAGDIPAALHALDRLDREAANWPLLLRMRLAYTRGIVQDSAGQLAAAEAALRIALELARSANAPIAIATCESQLGTVLLRRGQAGAAVPTVRAALAVFERVGRLHDVARLSNVLAVAALWSGDLATAQDKARLALRLFEEVGYRVGQSGAADTLGQVLLQQGRLDEARRCFELSIDAVPDSGMTFEPIYHLLEVCMRLERTADAARLVAQMNDRMRQFEGHHAAARYTLLAGARLASATDPGLARRWAEALLADPGLDDDLRRDARALAGDAPPLAPVPAFQWKDFCEELATFLKRFR